MNKMLLIIDAQYDFIDGSLAVTSARDKMIALFDMLEKKKNDYDCVVFTADWHPFNHMSFIKNNGSWATHCVQYTSGAAIFNPLLHVVSDKEKVFVLTKGEDPTTEEYSILANEKSRKELLEIIGKNDIHQIDICGIANEFCVFNTVKDFVETSEHKDKLCILKDYIAAIENENVLFDYAKDNSIKMI